MSYWLVRVGTVVDWVSVAIAARVITSVSDWLVRVGTVVDWVTMTVAA